MRERGGLVLAPGPVELLGQVHQLDRERRAAQQDVALSDDLDRPVLGVSALIAEEAGDDLLGPGEQRLVLGRYPYRLHRTPIGAILHDAPPGSGGS